MLVETTKAFLQTDLSQMGFSAHLSDNHARMQNLKNLMTEVLAKGGQNVDLNKAAGRTSGSKHHKTYFFTVKLQDEITFKESASLELG